MSDLDALVLRPFNAADLGFVFEGLSDPQVIKHYGVSYDSLDACREQMDWFESLAMQGTGHWLAIESKTDGRPMGAVGVNDISPVHHCAELGYWLLPQYWGQGIVSRALKLFLSVAFEQLQLHRIEAVVELENHRSRRVLEAAGFTHEGVRRECELKHGEYISLMRFGLLSHEWVGGR